MCLRLPFLFLLIAASLRAADDYKPGPDSLPQQGVPKGELIKGQYTAKEGSVFPGTERDYTIYLPPGLDKSKPAPFMVFQDGVIYQAPTVLDNLIAKKEIPSLVGIFIKPGVVPAANPNALPRFNRSYEYDSVTDTYARFLIDEFLPAISQTHGLNLSTDPNDAAIAGNSSGGICAFMVAWHRPDRFRRVFTGVGTYVGIHGADQVPVLIRKMEPKPLRVYLQSGTNDNNLYCGDWWMANQMMERSLTWAGYDVNHTWGEGGHNQKHATAIFPDVLRWLWKGWPEQKEVKANPREDSMWKGYEVLADGGWKLVSDEPTKEIIGRLAGAANGTVYMSRGEQNMISTWSPDGAIAKFESPISITEALQPGPDNTLLFAGANFRGPVDSSKFPALIVSIDHPDKPLWAGTVSSEPKTKWSGEEEIHGMAITAHGWIVHCDFHTVTCTNEAGKEMGKWTGPPSTTNPLFTFHSMTLSPDQSLVYLSALGDRYLYSLCLGTDGTLSHFQKYYQLETNEDDHPEVGGLCVDTEGRLYTATKLGVQVCDQAGRVNFIIPTPEQPFDVCFGGKDLSELFIACGDRVYRRPMKVHGIVSGQMPPIKPKAPHL